MDAEFHKMIMKKAGALLGRRAYSRGQLRDKLAKIAGEVSIEAVLDHLEQLNLLNDADYAYNFAFWRIKQQGWGPAKVNDSLLRRQIEQPTIDGALQRVRNELHYESILTDYVQRYCGKQGPALDPKTVRSLVLHLRQRGFDEDGIVGALKKVIPAAILKRFETGE